MTADLTADLAADLAALVASSRRARIDAIRTLPPTDALRFALRRVLFTDAHAEVRAAAARRLAQLANVEAWLVDALADASPLVRDAVLRALARAGTTACVSYLLRLVDEDRMWWVRRAAVYALAAIAGEAEVPTFTRALADPFWRVRHAAVKVLAVLGAASPALRDEVIASATDTTTLAFLRSSWGPVALEAPQRAAAPSELPTALLDPDPAVVTARLLAGDFPPRALVELLCDPHVPLRSLAVHRIARSQDRAALEAALDWLEEPRIPHVVDTVHQLLDGLGDLAAELAAHVLSPMLPDRRRGAARWAIGWVVATQFEALYPAALERAHAAPSLRNLALRLADDATLVAWAADDPFLVDAIAVELHERRRPSSHDALLALDAAAHPRLRALQLDVHARRGNWSAVARGLTDPHHGPRAVAARWVSRAPFARQSAPNQDGAAVPRADAPALRADAPALRADAPALHADAPAHSIDLAVLSTDVDPAVREAVLTADNAASVFVTDVDPFVRRAAIATVAQAWHDRPADALPPMVVEATHAALAARDPWIRARACALQIVDDRALALVLALLGDRDEMVRSAALDAMSRVDNADARIAALLARLDDAPLVDASPVDASSTDDIARAMGRAWLARSLDDAAITALRDVEAETRTRHIDEVDLDADGSDPESTDVDEPRIAATAGAPGVDASPIDAPRLDAPRLDAPRAVHPLARPERRAFGRAGFDVAPLAISGAYDLSPSGLARAEAAGVDLYFWEPGYDVLARFLRQRARRDRLRVITGSYHADAPSIRADVDRALRKLRRETLDAFLLFWTRSHARVDEEAYGVLDELRRAGKIRAVGFSTHHRDLAREAIEQQPWDVVMIRHSAAHPGIERVLLPTARERGTAIVTFSALCYGRMISGPNAPTASECYRYSLSQPGVTACISAPRRYREVVENLGVLAEPTLPAERIEALREHGRGVHAESSRFNALVRQPTRDAAVAAREMLAAELPPEDATAVRRPLPKPSHAKRSRTRLGSIRRGR